MDMGILSYRDGQGTSTSTVKTHINEAASTSVADVSQVEALKQQSTTEPDREQVLAAVTEMQNFVQAAHHNVQFQLDEDSGRMLVKVTERDSGEVIRQIPSEEAVRLAENLSEIRSLLFSGEV